MSKANAFETALNNELNKETVLSENGAVMHATSGHKLLDINFAASSLRNKTSAEVETMFSAAYNEDPLLAVKWLFMLRDARGGMGERESFRKILNWLAMYHEDKVMKLVSLIPEYGRWDDVLSIYGVNEKIDAKIISLIDQRISSDYESMKEGKSISLLAKWLPSINTSSSETRALAHKICSALGLSEKNYRKMLSKMRAYLNVVEVKASAKNWNEIDYEAVPSQANLKYKNAFLRNDEARRRAFLEKLTSGEVKINASTNFPSDIVHTYSSGYGYYYGSRNIKKDETLEAMWKALPDMCINGNVLAVVDGSGSMMTCVSQNSGCTALEVANALGLYCAEHLTGPFKDKFITFSSRPQYVDVSKASSLAEKLTIAYKHNECSNTNIEATLDLVLKTAVNNNLKQEDIPTLVILSDMEFDYGSEFYGGRSETLMQAIARKWGNYGYKLPRIIWWNIAGRTGSVPMQQNDCGIILTSGYSQSQFKLIASNRTDPYEVLVEALNAERYQPIEDALK